MVCTAILPKRVTCTVRATGTVAVVVAVAVVVTVAVAVAVAAAVVGGQCLPPLLLRLIDSILFFSRNAIS